MHLTETLLLNYDQIVIYGAKGWVGRSAVELLFNGNPNLIENQILLIGTKTQSAREAHLPFNVYSTSDAYGLLGKKIIFLNAAFLRREKLNEMNVLQYEKANQSIAQFGLDLINSRRVKTFVNLSSGVANQGKREDIEDVTDPYAKAKIILESLYAAVCNSANSHLINCRIYSMSGKYINEFNNLALTSFLAQGMKEQHVIKVNSPSTLRSYVDSIDLVNVLFRLALQGSNLNLDSGGELISLGDLAEIVCSVEQNARVVYPEVFEKSPDYFGDYKLFNEFAKSLGVPLKNIKEQVLETSKALL
jgi:nucleoside-diphosphate-sugar epimerase